MYRLLTEIIDPNLLRLTTTQKAVLLTVHAAQTPQLAYEAATGSEYIIASRNFLAQHSLIRLSKQGAELSDMGYESLMSNGLIDDMGEVTEIGATLLASFDKEKKEIMESKIPFRTIKQLNR